LSLSTLLLTGIAGVARAQEPGPPAHPPETLPAPVAIEGASAESIVKAIEGRAAKDAATAKVVKEPLENAKKSLERAHGARAAGDEAHGKQLDALALEWATMARDLERAAAAERVAAEAAQKARDVATQAERARTLLEETQARRLRAAAELDRVEAEAKDAVKNAASAEHDRIDKQKRQPSKPKGNKKKGEK
jgi:hypothetical protein